VRTKVIDKQPTPASAELTSTIIAQEVIQSNVTVNTTWVKTKRYLLKGNVYVVSGAILTIEPGTVIFGDKLTKGSLVVSRGATINAVGTESEPIVFTSSSQAGVRNYGDWGGVVILGNATNNQSSNQIIEGISAASGDNGKYGGDADTESSGIFKYVRIEFAGIAFSPDNELNGLTLGSVGSGTIIDHIQISYSGDDSYEWFGGAVNGKYLIAYRGWDDDFDTDFGFSGNVQYGVSYRDPNIADKSGSNGFESDNNGSGTGILPLTSAKFSNISWFGPGVFATLNNSALDKTKFNTFYQYGAHIRRNTALQVYNSVFLGSYLQGVHFDFTNSSAVFQGNYFGRIGANLSSSNYLLNTSSGFNTGNFTTDNFFAVAPTTVDLSTTFVGLGSANISINSNPLSVSLLASGSPLLSGAKTVPSGLEQTTYIGAFDASNNWAIGTWTNYIPNTTEY
jgi:hypothetical protein